MAGEDGGGFGWGLLLGGLIGVAAGAYLASGPAREQVDSLRNQTVELTGPDMRARARAAADRAGSAVDRARSAVVDADNPIRRAVQEGISAARRRRTELETETATGTTEGGGAG